MSAASTTNDRVKQLRRLLDAKPAVGTVLRAKDGTGVPVTVQRRVRPGGGLLTLLVNAHVDEEATGWFLTPEERGLKCLILPISQKALIQGNNGNTKGLCVKAVRVVRQRVAHRVEGVCVTSLLCEVVA